MRAYVAKDGSPAAFSKANVPYRPKHWLHVSQQGIKPGDLVFVTGYPGRTQRHQTYAQVKETTEWSLPRSIRNSEEQLAILDALSKNDKELALAVSSRVQSLNNGLTKNRGVLEGLVKGGSLAKKEAAEKKLEAWIAADSARRKKYGDILPALRALQSQSEKTRERDSALSALASASSYLSAAQTIYRLSLERTKPDIERESGFQERDWARIRESQDRLQRTLNVTADRALLRRTMGLAIALPADQRIPALDQAAGVTAGMSRTAADAAVDAFLTKLFAGTKLGDRDFRLGLLERNTSEVMATKDPFVLLAAQLEPLAEANREASKNRSGALTRLMPRYMEALLARAGGLVAPDANSTLRITYGQVKGVDARDGILYKPQTTLKGIVEKNTGQRDFDAPKAQLDAIQAFHAGKKTPFVDAALKDVPVNFLSTVDTTNGNSGSPTLNAKGELVGLLFDGTYETVASDYVFDTVRTRSIHVDARYMLWNMAEVDGAGRLLKEMGVLESQK